MTQKMSDKIFNDFLSSLTETLNICHTMTAQYGLLKDTWNQRRMLSYRLSMAESQLKLLDDAIGLEQRGEG